jgi:hypothetical protein
MIVNLGAIIVDCPNDCKRLVISCDDGKIVLADLPALVHHEGRIDQLFSY